MALGQSQRAFAAATGAINYNVLSRLERGSRWNTDQIDAVAAALGCDPADLLSPEPPDPDEVRMIAAMRSQDAATIMGLMASIIRKWDAGR